MTRWIALAPLYRLVPSAWRRADSAAAEFVRYLGASALALATDFSLLVLLTEVAGVHYLASAAAGFGAGVVVAYLLSIRWVFARRRLSSVAAETTIFILIGLAGLVVNQIVMFSLTELALLPYTVSKACSACIVFSFNFGVRKLALFTVRASCKPVAQ